MVLFKPLSVGYSRPDRYGCFSDDHVLANCETGPEGEKGVGHIVTQPRSLSSDVWLED